MSLCKYLLDLQSRDPLDRYVLKTLWRKGNSSYFITDKNQNFDKTFCKSKLNKDADLNVGLV